jgi:hypothetical protein
VLWLNYTFGHLPASKALESPALALRVGHVRENGQPGGFALLGRPDVGTMNEQGYKIGGLRRVMLDEPENRANHGNGV